MQNIAKRASRERARLASLAQIGELARRLSKILYVNLSLIPSLSRSGQTSLVFLVTGKTLKTLSHEYIAIQIVIFENPVKPGQKDKRSWGDYSQPVLLISLLTPTSSDQGLTSQDIWCGQVVFKMFLIISLLFSPL